ncbi:hypothetical protein RRG08_025859 [Elysia crispata]|uniref:Uncharacterized protein n=1 Tax=Elysia crispata TaxID=231223 RepID=A0AAE0Y322_9GAST|nr:hypothetical protein RRG08_025859 [Elysia crispata]
MQGRCVKTNYRGEKGNDTSLVSQTKDSRLGLRSVTICIENPQN